MWLLKILIKIIISRLPIKYSIWRRIGIFRHGGMDNYEYSKKIFFGHLEDMKKYRKIKNPTILELGPGDGITSAIYSSVLNSPKIYLVDVKPFAENKVDKYLKIFNLLKKEYRTNISLKNINSINSLLKECNAVYLTNGLSSLRNIEDSSIDYLFSHSVMEHIKFSEIKLLVREMHRILKPNGVMSHNINYKDHLEDSLNNLRFSNYVWESEFISKSGFYTNRIPAVEMHKIFKENGFEFYFENYSQWKKLPIKRKYINKYFAKYSDIELINCTSSFIAKKINLI